MTVIIFLGNEGVKKAKFVLQSLIKGYKKKENE